MISRHLAVGKGLQRISARRLLQWIQEAQAVTGIPYDYGKGHVVDGPHLLKAGDVHCPATCAGDEHHSSSGEADRSGRNAAKMSSVPQEEEPHVLVRPHGTTSDDTRNEPESRPASVSQRSAMRDAAPAAPEG